MVADYRQQRFGYYVVYRLVCFHYFTSSTIGVRLGCRKIEQDSDARQRFILITKRMAKMGIVSSNSLNTVESVFFLINKMFSREISRLKRTRKRTRRPHRTLLCGLQCSSPWSGSCSRARFFSSGKSGLFSSPSTSRLSPCLLLVSGFSCCVIFRSR